MKVTEQKPSLRTTEQILQIKKPIPTGKEDGPGIYFLIHEDRIVYVGRSVSPINRVMNHAQGREKKFDSYTILYMSDECSSLDHMEAAYIWEHCPRHNVTMPTNPWYLAWGAVKRTYPAIDKHIVNKLVRLHDVEVRRNWYDFEALEPLIIEALEGRYVYKV